MKKINFKAIEIEDIENKKQHVDVSKPLGNQLYLQGNDVEECDLGRAIYYSEGEMQLTDKQAQMVLNVVQAYPYLTRHAISELLKD